MKGQIDKLNKEDVNGYEKLVNFGKNSQKLKLQDLLIN